MCRVVVQKAVLINSGAVPIEAQRVCNDDVRTTSPSIEQARSVGVDLDPVGERCRGVAKGCRVAVTAELRRPANTDGNRNVRKTWRPSLDAIKLRPSLGCGSALRFILNATGPNAGIDPAIRLGDLGRA